MFTLPTNTTPQVRPDVVNHIVKAMFKTKHMNYCDDRVFTDEVGGFDSYWSPHTGRPSVRFTMDERNAAFEEFKDKGYHIFKETWRSSANGHLLWSYGLSETKDFENAADITWLF